MNARETVKAEKEPEDNKDKPGVEKLGLVKAQEGKEKKVKKKDEADELKIDKPEEKHNVQITPIDLNVNIDNIQKDVKVKKSVKFSHDEKGRITGAEIEEKDDDNKNIPL